MCLAYTRPSVNKVVYKLINACEDYLKFVLIIAWLLSVIACFSNYLFNVIQLVLYSKMIFACLLPVFQYAAVPRRHLRRRKSKYLLTTSVS